MVGSAKFGHQALSLLAGICGSVLLVITITSTSSVHLPVKEAYILHLSNIVLDARAFHPMLGIM
jgi:hypothetical protein